MFSRLLNSTKREIISNLINSFICESRNFVCSTPPQTIRGERQRKVRHVFLTSKWVSSLRTHNFSKLIKIYHPPTVKRCYFHQEIEKPPSVACNKHWKNINDDTVGLFSVNCDFFFLKESISQFSFRQRTYLNNQPCDQAISGIVEHSSSKRK